MAHGDALPGQRGCPLPEDLARAAGAGLERPGHPGTPDAGERRVAGGADRGVRTAALRAWHRTAAGGAGVAGGDVQPRHHDRGAGRHRHRAPRATGLDRPMDNAMTGPGREQSRARYPDSSGYIKRDGVRLYYEVYGSGEPTVLLLPTWSIIHSRHWKMQIPYLARHCRVVTFDGRGKGRSERPAAGYRGDEFASDTQGGAPLTQWRVWSPPPPGARLSSRSQSARSALSSWRLSTRTA